MDVSPSAASLGTYTVFAWQDLDEGLYYVPHFSKRRINGTARKSKKVRGRDRVESVTGLGRLGGASKLTHPIGYNVCSPSPSANL
jgi:hypothetical protein